MGAFKTFVTTSLAKADIERRWIIQSLARIEKALATQKQELIHMSNQNDAANQAIADLTAVVSVETDAVAANGLVIDHAVDLLGELKTDLDKALAGTGTTIDPATISALRDKVAANLAALSSGKDKLSAAVVANTPAAAPPVASAAPTDAPAAPPVDPATPTT